MTDYTITVIYTIEFEMNIDAETMEQAKSAARRKISKLMKTSSTDDRTLVEFTAEISGPVERVILKNDNTT